MSFGKKLKSVPLVSSAVWHVDHHFEVLHDLHRLQRESGGDMVLAFEALERVLLRLQEVAANTGKSVRQETIQPIAATLQAVKEAGQSLAEARQSLAEIQKPVTELLPPIATTLHSFTATLASIRSALQQMAATLQPVTELRQPIEEISTALARIEGQLGSQVSVLDATIRDGFARQAEVMERLVAQLDKQSRGVLANGLRSGDIEPEPSLLQFLCSELGACSAVDVGANEGRVSLRLHDVGLEVFSLEPGPEAFGRLQSNLSSHPNCHPMQYAAGSVDGEAELHLVVDTTEDQRYAAGTTLYSALTRHALNEGLAFGRSVRVPVRRLDSLAAEGQIPFDIGILKIDAEGSDLDVIEGMGELRPEVVQVEFWDPEFVFGAAGSRNTLQQAVPSLRAMGYRRHIVIARMPEGPVVYYCNLPASIPNTWGNAVFFLEESSFQAARRWCEASITPAYLYR